MDDKRLFELKALELAYNKQLMYMGLMMAIALLGLVLYIINIYSFNFQLLLVSIMLITVSIIVMMGVDTKLRDINKNIKKG